MRSNEFDKGLARAKSLSSRMPRPYPEGYCIDKKDRAPCVIACPANLNVQGFTAMVREGKYREAVEIMLREMPIAGTLGRVCPHPCESSCRRALVDEPVSIREIQRMANDRVDLNDIPIPDITPTGKRVAIVGSGPAGLTAAYFLAQEGVDCTIYEAMPEPGGMLRYGIPEFRLPRWVLDKEINYVKRFGVKIETGVKVGTDISFETIKKDYDALYLGVGAWQGYKPRIPNEDLENVVDVIQLLSRVHLGEVTELPGKVIIIGGGHSAFDAARICLRLGSDEVHIVYRRALEQMPAGEEELVEARKEGIHVHFLVAPVQVTGENGKVTGLECIKTRLSDPDDSGRRRPVSIEGSEFHIDASWIIPAVGQAPILDFIPDGENIGVSQWKLLEVDPATFMTSVPGIFAGGDAVTGPATVVKAVDAGKRAARNIALYLEGKELPKSGEEDRLEGSDWNPVPENIEPRPRMSIPTREFTSLKNDFEEVNLTVDNETATKEAERCLDCGECCECFECVKACGPGAVNLQTHAQTDETLEVGVGSVILAPGFEPFDPSVHDTYGYTKNPNVITSMEFERILSATGPTMGHVARPSDHKDPKKIAWLMCVGSRDMHEGAKGYCSSVCCTYAIKQAVIAKEHVGKDLDTAIFYIDIRTHGKDFEKYYNRARDEAGVRFIKSRISSIDKFSESGSPIIRYVDESGKKVEEEYDLVVLSVGLCGSQSNTSLAQTFDIDLGEYGYPATDSFEPVRSSKPGIFVCGAFQGPKDIPSSVVDASAAAGVAGSMLSESRETMTRSVEPVPEVDIRGEAPRIGVFVCHCGTNIAGVVDVKSLAEYARTLPYVAHVEESLFTCSQDTQDKMAQIVKDKKLNRIVVAACTPRTHEPLFRQTLVGAGLNKYLFEMANIRNQCSWVHAGDHQAATDKSMDLVRMAVAKAALLEPLTEDELQVTQTALVIGGGVAGLVAAKNLAEQGYPTSIIEKTGELGGKALGLADTWKGEDVRKNLERLIEDVKARDNIDIYTNAVLESVDGFVGNFKSTISTGDGQKELEHGVAIIATGAEELKPDQYLYGRDPRVVTGLELEQKLIDNDTSLGKASTAVFVQCVGSRIPERPYCSKICCTQSVKNAIKLKKRNPGMNIYIVNRDIRTYGLREELYREARKTGIHFIRHVHDKGIDVSADNGDLSMRFTDFVLQQEIELKPDLLVLASAVVMPEENPMAQLFKVPVNDDGFFVEAHVKLRPVEFATDGVFVCGLAHSPKPLDESVVQAQAAASRAVTVLSSTSLHVGGSVSEIRPDLCTGCSVCIAVCPYQAIQLNEKGTATVNKALCKGCGNCVSSCRSGAPSLKGFTDSSLFAQIQAC